MSSGERSRRCGKREQLCLHSHLQLARRGWGREPRVEVHGILGPLPRGLVRRVFQSLPPVPSVGFQSLGVDGTAKAEMGGGYRGGGVGDLGAWRGESVGTMRPGSRGHCRTGALHTQASRVTNGCPLGAPMIIHHPSSIEHGQAMDEPCAASAFSVEPQASSLWRPSCDDCPRKESEGSL